MVGIGARNTRRGRQDHEMYSAWLGPNLLQMINSDCNFYSDKYIAMTTGSHTVDKHEDIVANSRGSHGVGGVDQPKALMLHPSAPSSRIARYMTMSRFPALAPP